MFPQETPRALAEHVLTRDGRPSQYGGAEGYAPLRAYVAAMLAVYPGPWVALAQRVADTLSL